MTAIPQGYQFAAVHCGIKNNAPKLDVSLIVSDRPAVAAGVYTQNLVFAAPVAWDRAITPVRDLRAVVMNSGNANACTGERGMADAERMAAAAAGTCGASAKQALVLSTGVIGVFMPIEKIEAGIKAAGSELASDGDALVRAARGMMTTDSVHKLASRSLKVGGKTVQVTGMAKGAAMIGPNMATMLGVVLTDAMLDPAAAQSMLIEIADETFNCISVEGHTSTNDTVLLLANGASGCELVTNSDLATFRAALLEVCSELARAIPADGEGVTHLVQLEVHGCRTAADARTIAKSVANSALVKTAIHGADPNWGRIVSAAGYAGVKFNPAKVDLHVNHFLLYQQGAPVSFNAAQVSTSIRDNRETHVVLKFGEGDASCRFWTTDLTAEYVRLNADYTT